jgi:hypothetical protein
MLKGKGDRRDGGEDFSLHIIPVDATLVVGLQHYDCQSWTARLTIFYATAGNDGHESDALAQACNMNRPSVDVTQ